MQKEKRTLKNEDGLRDFWDNVKQTNTWIIGVPKGGKREKGIENLFKEIMDCVIELYTWNPYNFIK